MAKHRQNSKPTGTDNETRANDSLRFASTLETLAAEALRFVAQERVAAMVRQWLGGATAVQDDARVIIDAGAFASFLALFAPSASGATAIDRLVRQRPSLTEDERVATTALRASQFRVMRVEAAEAKRSFILRDLASGEALSVRGGHLDERSVGMVLAGRVALFDATTHVLIGPVISLDSTALDAARAYWRPDGKGLTNPQRCAETIYRHAIRHGQTNLLDDTQSMGDGARDALPFAPEGNALDALAFAWAKRPPDATLPAEDIQQARGLTSVDALVDALAASVVARERGHEGLAKVYARLAEIQIEVFRRRTLADLGGPTLESVSAAIVHAIAAGEVPATARPLLEDLRRKVRFASSGRTNDAAEERLIQRIQALRAKTVAQGCTEQEALAAAEKVAELLDRYGLSLSELELRHQACQGIGVETGRRRLTPLDDCVPAIAAFFDCRAWSERLPSGDLRHIFFGLRGDVEAAGYLYALVDTAFVTETASFAMGELYRELDTGGRRSSTRSFQVGLGRGIQEKLQALREARENALRSSSGRDLVPLKAAVVDGELDRLGLQFHARSQKKKRLVLVDAYAAGQAAGRRFEYRAALAG